MKNAPCAKLMMRMMPKISVSPTPRKNSSAACESALRHWVTRKARKSIQGALNPAQDRRSTHARDGVDGRVRPGHDGGDGAVTKAITTGPAMTGGTVPWRKRSRQPGHDEGDDAMTKAITNRTSSADMPA